MDKDTKIALGILGGATLVGGIVVAVMSGKKTPGPPPVGPASFTVGIANLPAGADHWSLAFQNPATGIWYQRSNLPFPPPPGSGLLKPTDVAPMSVPVSTGVLSILAAEGTGSNTDSGVVVPVIIASHQIHISVIDGGSYTFDFNTQKLS
jgi:hypothetical protein